MTHTAGASVLVEGAGKSFGRVTALREVSLKVQPGEAVAIALIVGAISVANTMAMSIIERQGELALLSTVGWSPVRVVSLIFCEGIA